MGLTRLLVFGQGAGVLGIGGIYAFAVLAGHFQEGLVLHAVGADERGRQAVAAHLLDQLGSHGLVAAENHDVGLGAARLRTTAEKSTASGVTASKSTGFRSRPFHEHAVVVGKTLAVVAVVMQVGDFLAFSLLSMKSLVSRAWALSLATVRKKSGCLPSSVRRAWWPWGTRR